MVTEDYVSFETAKLLKENGFDDKYTNAFYDKTGRLYFIDLLNDLSDHPDNDTDIAASTLYMAMKWLREVHNIFFNVNYFHIDVGNKWACLTIWLPYKNGCESSIEGFDIETIYESAIKYCLENLI